jgi:hypothetical protein
MELKIITLEETAFYELLAKAVDRVIKERGEHALDKWIDGAEAMRMLRIQSKTTLQKLRDEGEIRYSSTKTLLYDRDSINAYIERNAKDRF